MSTAVSPLAPTNVPDMPAIDGVRLATAQAGIRYKNRTDVLLAAFDKGTTVAGVFTRSKCPSAPVEWCRARLKAGKARALVVNSGNANAFTGRVGPRRHATHREARRASAWLQRERRFPRLHRRDRRTARCHQVRRRDADARRRRGARTLPRRRQGDHDHRHLSEGRDRAGEGSARRSSPSTASPRAPA